MRFKGAFLIIVHLGLYKFWQLKYKWISLLARLANRAELQLVVIHDFYMPDYLGYFQNGTITFVVQFFDIGPIMFT